MAETFYDTEEQIDQEDPKPKLKVKDFAAKIKAKYPEYKDVDDTELTNRIIAKYPEYKEQVDFGVEKKNLGGTPSSNGSNPYTSNGLSQGVNKLQPIGKVQQNLKSYNPYKDDQEEIDKKSVEYFNLIDHNHPDPLSTLPKAKNMKESLAKDRAVGFVLNQTIPDGFEAKKILQDPNIIGDKGNETKRLLANHALEKEQEYEKVVGGLRNINPETPMGQQDIAANIRNAAIKSWANENPVFKKRVEAMGLDLNDEELERKLPQVEVGKIFKSYINKPEVQTFLQKENPALFNSVQTADKDLLKNNPEYAINEVANEISRERLKQGQGRAFNGYYGKEKEEATNKLAEELYKDNPEKLAVYNNTIRKHQTDYIDDPSFLGGVATGIKSTLEDMGKLAKQPFISNKEIAYDKMQEEASNISANPQGFLKYTNDFGHLTGFLMSLGAAEATTGLSATNALTLATSGGIINDARDKYPNRPDKAAVSAALNMIAFRVMGKNIFPTGKIGEALSGIKPELNKVVDDLASGSIAKKEAQSQAQKIISKGIDYVGGAAKKDVVMSAELTAIKGVNQLWDKLNMSDEEYQQAHPDGELWEDFTHNLLLNAPIAGLAKLGEMKNQGENAERSVATEVKSELPIADEQKITSNEKAIPEGDSENKSSELNPKKESPTSEQPIEDIQGATKERPKEEIVKESVSIADDIKDENWRNAFLENPEQGLKEIAQQLHGEISEADGANKTFGKRIADLALELYPTKESTLETKAEAEQAQPEEPTTEITETKKEEIIPPSEPPPAEPIPVAEGEGDAAGITHAANEVRRQDRKLPEYERSPETFEKWNAEAEQKLKEGYDVEDLFNRMEKETYDPTPVENSIRKIYIATLDAEIAKNPTDELLAKQKRFIELGDLANSRAGKNLVSLKGEGSPLSSLSDFYVAKMQATGQDKLTEAQKAETKKAYDDVQKTDADATAKIAALEEENAKLKAELEVKKAKASTKKQTKDYNKERADLKQSIKDKWNNASKDDTLTAVAVPYAKQLMAIAPDVAKLMKSYIEEGVTEFGEIVKRLHAAVKEVEPKVTEKDIADIISGQYDTKKETREDLRAKLRSIKNKKSEEAIKIIAKIKSGDFAKPEKNLSWVENPEVKKKFPNEYNAALDAIKAKEDARHEFDIALLRDEMSRWGVKEKLGDWVGKAAGTVKAITTGIDDSALAIQTYVSLLRRPRTGAKAVYEHFRQGFSKNAQKKFDRWLSALHSSSDFKDMKEDGLDVTEPQSLKEREKEEIFNSRFNGTVKYKGKDGQQKEVKLIDAPLKPFERAFTTLGNVTRVTGYRLISAKYRREGYTREKDPELFKSLARRLNEQTGRGKVNEYVEQANKVVTLGIWSPKLMAQKFNMLGISDLASLFVPGTKGYYRQLHPKERMAAIRDVAQFAATVAAMSYGLALMTGGEVDDDPLSSTYMDVKLPSGKSYNLTGGFSGYIRAISQFMTGKKHKGDKTIKVNPLETAGRFFRGKTPPLTSAGMNIASGKNFMGQPTTPLDEAINLAPISLRGIAQQIQNDGAESFLTQGIPTFFGFNVKNEKDYQPKVETFKIHQKNGTKVRESTEEEVKKVDADKQVILEKKIKEAESNKGWGLNKYGELTTDDDAIKKRGEYKKLSDDEKKDLETRLKAAAGREAKKKIKY